MAKKWKATKQIGNAIEYDDEEEISFEMTNQNACCLLKCELPLRWGLPCRYWMYFTFVDNSPILLSLIHPRWFLDGSDYLDRPWIMSYSLDLAFAYLSLHGTAQPKSTPTTDSIQEMLLPNYKRYASD